MKKKENRVILISYPQAFGCYEKFERKISRILNNFDCFNIAYISDQNNFISKYISSNNHINDTINFSIDDEHLNNVSHAIIFNDGKTFNHLIKRGVSEFPKLCNSSQI